MSSNNTINDTTNVEIARTLVSLVGMPVLLIVVCTITYLTIKLYRYIAGKDHVV